MTTAKLNPKQQNRRQIFWTTTLVIVIVSLMTWYDLQPNKFLTMQAPEPPLVAFRFVGNAQDAASLPDDGSALLVWQGYLSLGANNEAVYEGVDFTPQNFPQRQMDLHIGLADLDSDSDITPLREHLVGLVKSWEVKSNIVSDIYFDVRGLALDDAGYDRLRQLIKQFRDKTAVTYRVNIVDDPARHAAMTLEKREALYADAGFLVVALPADATNEKTAEMLRAAEGLNRPYRVLAQTGNDPISYLADEKAKSKYFGLLIVGQPPEPKGAENREP